VLCGREAVLEFVAFAGRAAHHYVIEWGGEPLTVQRDVGARSLRGTVAGSIDRWLSVDGALEGDGELLRLGHLVAELSRGRRFVRSEGSRFVYVEDRLRRWVPSTKLRARGAMVRELRAADHRVLVFSQFVRLLERARTELEATGARCADLVGATPTAERAALGRSLDAGELDVLLISLKAGGTGLTLTGASYVIHLDPWWNPAVEDQASDRAHRIGQTQPVTVLRLVSAGTVEDAVLAMREEKRALVDAVLEGSPRGGALDRDELLAPLRPLGEGT
jgi:SNF2 family DNA or RNA helicase